MAKYQKYTEYKDSGIEWLGEIPNHWNVGNLKFSFVGIKNGATETQIEESNNTVPISRIESISTGEINYEKVGFVNKYSIAESYKINEGDILLSHINSLSMVGNIALKRDTSILYHGMNLLRLMPNKDKFDPKYLFWILKSKYFRNSVESIAKPAINQASVSIDSLKNISLLIPTKIEQQDIANFLDHETAKIDTLIAKQEKLIELLKEKRQAVISNLVAVQNNEPTIKLKYAVEILAGYSFSSAGFQIENDNGIPLLRGINVGVGSIKWDECVWWSKSDTNGLERYLLQEGDLVFGMDRPWISSGARVAEIKQTDLPSYLVQRVARIRCIDGFYQPYVKLVLGSKEFKSFIESDLTGVSVPHISTDQIISFEVRNLTYEQQVFETDKVIGFMFQVEELIDKAQSAIQLMQERRTALISSAVTGKIDVRNWQHPNEAKTGLSA
ncbi:restriction endonuclease subunit S [Acinetobacter baumannii]|uniref:restriction endonuclease subunit S n=1 Tax=Acinetobacter baumannii TaxID=470 RepID=UPI003AF51587